MPPEGEAGTTATAIERLSFEERQPHEPIEAAIHLSRYLLARGLCAGKTVLDVACGEGYGSHFMATRWGAARVHGVDISREAIDRATRLFGSERVIFHCTGVAQVGDLFAPEEFDLVVSLETIEHLADPQSFLEAARHLLKPSGTIVITCPNDHWYYRAPEARNPFHVRKYTFEEFRTMAEAVLGPAQRFLFGTPVSGFLNVDVGSALLDCSNKSRTAIFAAEDDVDAMLVPTSEDVSSKNCSYFVGIWGPATLVTHASSALVPDSMDQSGLAHLRAAVEAQRDEVAALRSRLDTSERELRDSRLRLLATTRENQILREESHRARQESALARRELEVVALPEDSSFAVRLRWSLSRMEPAFPRIVGPLKRFYRRFFKRA